MSYKYLFWSNVFIQHSLKIVSIELVISEYIHFSFSFHLWYVLLLVIIKLEIYLFI